MNAIRRRIGLLLLAGLSVGFSQAQDETLDPAVWAPADALAYLGVADSALLVRDLQATATFQMMNDPAAREAMMSPGIFDQFFKKIRARLAGLLEVEEAQLKNPLRGPAALFVTVARGEKLSDARPGLVARIGELELMKGYYASAVKKLRAASERHESESVGSFTIDVFTAKPRDHDQAEGDEEEEDELDADPFDEEALGAELDKSLDRFFSLEDLPPTLATCLADDRLIVAGSAEQVKEILRRDRAGTSLAEGDDYKALTRHFKPLGNLRLLVNLPLIFELAREGDEEAARNLALLGTKSLGSLIGHVRFHEAQCESKSELLLLMSGERSGLAKLFSMDNRPIAPDGAVAADAVLFSSLAIDVSSVVDEVERMIRQRDPDAADQMRAGLEKVPTPRGETIDLRKDLLAHLKPPLSLTLWFARPFGGNSARLLVTLAHRNQAAVEKVIGLLPLLVQRQSQGATLFDVMQGRLSLAPLSERVVFGNTDAVESALASSTGEGLASTPEFKRAAELMPTEAWALLYVDSRRMLEARIALAEKSEEVEQAAMSDFVAMFASQLLQSVAPDLKSDKLSQARQLLKYYAPGMIAIATTPEGLRYTQVQLKPAAE